MSSGCCCATVRGASSELQWSAHDLPLLDVARTLVEGPARAYGHVIVDEAQDLSPMQLLMVSRRAVDGSLTMLGDVAQATGPVTYGRWQELEPYLPEDTEVRIEELRHAYRVPAEIMELALPLLDRIAPDVEPPLAYRQGGAPPKLVRVGVDELVSAAAREAAEFDDGLLAIIGPRSLVESRSAGGHVLPHAAAGEGPRVRPCRRRSSRRSSSRRAGERGLRELYVALTRPTKTLVVVHSREWR